MNVASSSFDARRFREAGRHQTALIVKLGQIGDVIMAIPAAHALHEQGFEIQWVCGSAARPLLECYSWIQIVPVDDRAILRGNVFERAGGIIGLWSRLALRRYELCATLYYDRRFHLLTLPIRARRKVRLSRDSRASELIAGRHHSDEFARLLLGREDGCRETSIAPVAPDRLPPSPWPESRTRPRVAHYTGGTGAGWRPVSKVWTIGHLCSEARVRNWDMRPDSFGGTS